jgi:hypothetical protein
MRGFLTAGLVPMLLLAACSKTDEARKDAAASASNALASAAPAGDRSAADVAQQVARVKLKPGQWETSFSVTDLKMAGMPKGMPQGMEEQMKGAMSKRAIVHCVTPEEAEKPDASFFANQDKACTYNGFDMSGGAVKGTVTCTREGMTTTASMTGHYAPDSYDMAMEMNAAGGPNGMTMAMKATSAGRWIGPQCTAGAQ